MGKLIDSDWLRAQWDVPTDWMDGDQVLHHYTWYKTMIDLAPTVDAVPVVRCKNCRYWDISPASTAAPAYHECKARASRLGRVHTTAEEYCSRGEWKDGEQHGRIGKNDCGIA